MNSKLTLETQQDPLLSEITTPTIERMIAAFILDRRSQGISTRTVKIYQDELRYLTDFLRSRQVKLMDDLTAMVIREYMVELGTHRNPGGCHISYRVIKTWSLWYEQETDGDWRSPIRKIKPPKVPIAPIQGVPVADIERMIAACETDQARRDKAVLVVLLDTGVRADELIQAEMCDLDLLVGRLHISHGKGSKERDVFLGRRTRNVLRSYLKTRTDLRVHDPLFTTDDGERFTYYTLRQIIRRRSKNAGLTDTPSPHDFRRTFALECLRNGLDMNSIMRLMGHTTLVVLQRYLAQNTDDLQSAHRRVSPVDNMN